MDGAVLGAYSKNMLHLNHALLEQVVDDATKDAGYACAVKQVVPAYTAAAVVVVVVAAAVSNGAEWETMHDGTVAC
jgi:hypothetical protein